MADFVKDSMNQAQSGPQVISKAEAEQFKKEYGPELYNDLIKKNTIAVEENTKAIKDMQSQDRKTAEQNKKIEQDKKSLFNNISNKLSQINISYESLTQKQNINNIINNTAQGLKKITDQLGLFSTTLRIAIDAARIMAQVSFTANKNQIENNRLYTQLFGISSLSDQSIYSSRSTNFKKALNIATGKQFDYENEVNPMLNLISQSYNTAQLGEFEILKRLRRTLYYNRANPNLASIYNTMLGQSGGSESFIQNSMALFAKRFETNNLGLDKSLQQTKALYDSNRRFNMSMNEAAGYIQKFNKQLQDGTLTLQDVTVMRNAVKGYSTGQNAGIGQALINAGLGTPALLAAAGDPFKIAAIMREGKKPELDAMQKYLWDIAASQGLTDRQSMGERLRNLYSSWAGINLSDEQIRLVSQGRNYSLQAGAIAPKSSKVEIKNRGFEPDEALVEVLSKLVEQTTTNEDKITNGVKQGVSELLGTLNKIDGYLSEKLPFNLQKFLSTFGEGLNQAIYINIRGAINEYMKNNNT